jgi:phenylacetate-CoA ligase
MMPPVRVPRRRRSQELITRGLWHIRPGDREGTYQRLRESERAHPEELAAIQLHAAKELLTAAQSVPFYRDRLRAASLEPEDLRSIADLAVLPALERPELQHEGVRGLTVPGATGMRRTGSGSTGRPAQYLWGRNMMVWADAAERRSREWLGIDPGVSQVFLRARPPGREWASMRLRAATKNTRLVDAGLLADAEAIRRLVDRLLRDPPALIGGNSTCLYPLALAFLDDGRTPAFDVCLSSGCHLHEHYRAAMEAAFPCPVWDRYGTVEAGLVGHPCSEAGAFHVPAEVLLLEIVRDDGTPADAGEIGHVLVTTLRNTAMPLIRYRIGDLAVRQAAPCSCGRTLPVLERLVGRANDLLVTSEGGFVAPEVAVRLALTSAAGSILDFQISQHADLTIDVKVVQRDGEEAAVVRSRIAETLDELVRIRGATRVERVETIPLSAAGKLRHVVSAATPALSKSAR